MYLDDFCQAFVEISFHQTMIYKKNRPFNFLLDEKKVDAI